MSSDGHMRCLSFDVHKELNYTTIQCQDIHKYKVGSRQRCSFQGLLSRHNIKDSEHKCGDSKNANSLETFWLVLADLCENCTLLDYCHYLVKETVYNLTNIIAVYKEKSQVNERCYR